MKMRSGTSSLTSESLLLLLFTDLTVGGEGDPWRRLHETCPGSQPAGPQGDAFRSDREDRC